MGGRRANVSAAETHADEDTLPLKPNQVPVICHVAFQPLAPLLRTHLAGIQHLPKQDLARSGASSC